VIGMQGSVHRFDRDQGSGSVLLDDGREIPFDAPVFAASGLRHLRLGQRVSLQIGPEERLTRLWVVGIGADEPID
jgi:cold shock CspA family protein